MAVRRVREESPQIELSKLKRPLSTRAPFTKHPNQFGLGGATWGRPTVGANLARAAASPLLGAHAVASNAAGPFVASGCSSLLRMMLHVCGCAGQGPIYQQSPRHRQLFISGVDLVRSPPGSRSKQEWKQDCRRIAAKSFEAVLQAHEASKRGSRTASKVQQVKHLRQRRDDTQAHVCQTMTHWHEKTSGPGAFIANWLDMGSIRVARCLDSKQLPSTSVTNDDTAQEVAELLPATPTHPRSCLA